MKLILALMLAVAANAQPVLPLSVPRTAPTTGSVLLTWNFGNPRWNGLANVTTATDIAFGEFDTYLVSGLPIGSTNVFVAFNDAGISNLATGIAKPFVLKAEIKAYSYLVSVPTSTNGVTRILTSTNMAVWTTLRKVTNSGPMYQFVWTNDGAARFFHSVSP